MPYISIESGRLTAEQKQQLIEPADSNSIGDNPYTGAILHRYHQGIAG